MSNLPTTTTKSFFEAPAVRANFNELLGKRSSQFITSVLQIVASNDLLAQAEPASVYHAACVAATLDLPLNNNLGFAYIVPYGGKAGTKAQFQLGYKGFVQLALRSGQFNRIGCSPIYAGQILSADPLKGFEFDFSVAASGKPIGYAAYFRLINGYEATLYMTNEELNAHGKMYSQSFKKGYGLWVDKFDSMAGKTVLKLLLAKYAPLSIEMQKAINLDQAVIHNEEATDFTYADNDPATDKGLERAISMIESADSVKQLDKLEKQFGPELLTQVRADIDSKRAELSNTEAQ